MYPFRVYQISDLEEYYSLSKFILVFARTKSEAIDLAGNYINGNLGADKMNKSPWIWEEAISSSPHVIENPVSCRVCERWGYSPIGDDGLCDSCRKELQAGNIG